MAMQTMQPPFTNSDGLHILQRSIIVREQGRMKDTQQGSLVIVGTGISVAGQMTLITQNHIRQADVVFTVTSGKPNIEFIKSLNSNTYSLTDLYEIGKSRVQTYQDMCDHIIQAVQQGNRVCAAFYGHPGVFVNPSHKVIEILKEQKYSVKMEPGISAEDCLIADLGIDPAEYGCQSYEATQFLFRKYTIDPYMTQIIWQIWGVGDHKFLSTFHHDNKGLSLLVEILRKHYPDDHQVIIYEARTTALVASRIEELALIDLPSARLTAISTLVIPSLGLPEYDSDVLDALGITESDIQQHLTLTPTSK
jgi:uncharacterized protein YabN with tetrapyrrole methylase and pyrophosphatase domain